MTAELEHLEKELSQVEGSLQAPRQYVRGRAQMNSIGDSLASVGRQLQERCSASSGSSWRDRLNQRLETAQLAFSSRTPLGVVQQRRQSAVLAQSTTTGPSPSRITQSLPPRAIGGSSQRRPSLLLASRRSQREGFEVSLEHYESVVSGIDNGASKRKLEVLDDLTEEGSQLDTEDEASFVTAPPLPSVLLNKSQSESLVKLLSDSSVSGSITSQPDVEKEPAQPQAGSVLYSWGNTGLVSLHDDDSPRTVENSLVGNESRLCKPGAKAVISVATSSIHSSCCLASGTVLTWGQNLKGVVDPYARSVEQMARPQMLEAISNMNIKIRQVACGYDHTAALSQQGTVLTWGSNEKGQLGHRVRRNANNNPQTYCSPQGLVMTGGQRAASIACGNSFTLVLTTRMCVLTCGEETITSCTGGKGAAASSIPALQGLPLVAVAAGDHHAVVLTSNGTALAWGKNESGCCGRPFPLLTMPVAVHFADESTTATTDIFPHWSLPDEDGQQNAKISDDFAIIHACAGANHTVFVTRSGRLMVCGSNSQGQLGTADQNKISPAQPIPHPEAGGSFIAAEAGSNHSLLLDNEGSVWQMGGTDNNGLHCVLMSKKILSIAAGGDQSIALAAGEGTKRRTFSIVEDPAKGSVISDSSLMADNLEDLIETIAEDYDRHGTVGEQLAKGVEELLQNSAVLNSVFLDAVELDKMYVDLVAVGNAPTKQAIATAMETGIARGLESIAPDKARMIYPEAVRCLLLYIRFVEQPPEGLVFDLHGKVIAALMEAILGLPFEGYKAFMKWASALYPGDLFVKMLVRPLISQLDKSLQVTVDNNEVHHPSLSVGAVPLIVSVLQWLYQVADQLDIANVEDFYVEALDDVPTEALFEDLWQLKAAKKANKRPSNFLISESPFLFSPGVKQSLLQIESQIEMFKVASKDGGIEIDRETGSVRIDPFWQLEIEREHMLEQTLEIIKTTKPEELRKKLQVVFKGEEGIDAGGVTKEFFQLLSEELFDVSSGLWTDRFGDNVTWFNADCTWDIEGFELAGVLVGLAMYNSVLLDVHFPTAVYRKLLGYPLGLEDMVDESLQKGFQQLLDWEDDDVEYIFCLSFEVTWTDDLGMEERRELKPGGSDIPVTNDNREEYVRLYTEWLLVDSIHQQWEAFERGVTRIIEGLSLDLLFRPEELKLLVVGSPELDFDALQANTEYEAGYDENSPTIQNFWKFIKGADPESQLNFLKFAAGSSMAPIGGLGNLKFKIQRDGSDSPRLPTSHTCFNTLLLPDYDSYDKLESCLSRAILECEGFGLE